jgi:hypothetical protein
LMLIKLNKISIKWRLFIYLLSFVAATLILLWLFQVVFLDAFYKSIKIGEIKSSAVSIAKNIDSANLNTLVKQIAKNSEAFVTISAENGKSVYSAD